MINRSLSWEDIITCEYACNERAPKYIRQKSTELKGERDNGTIVGDFNTLNNWQNKSQKTSKDVEDKEYYHQLDQTDIYWIFHPAEDTFFSNTHGTFFRAAMCQEPQ